MRGLPRSHLELSRPLCVQIRRSLDADRAREAAAARAEVDRELDALRRTREAAAAAASELRGRLLNELDSVAGQDAASRRAAAQVGEG